LRNAQAAGKGKWEMGKCECEWEVVVSGLDCENELIARAEGHTQKDAGYRTQERC